MRKILTRVFALCAAASFVFGSVSTYAYELDSTSNSVEEETYQNNKDEDFANNSQVFAQINSHYEVTIPKVIVLSGETKSASYEVCVSGDIAGNQTVFVNPDNEFLLSTKNKEDQKATITQEKTTWNCIELGEDTTGLIEAPEITAGHWSGTFDFNIKLETSNEYVEIPEHEHNWSEFTTASNFDGKTRECSVCHLIDSRYNIHYGLATLEETPDSTSAGNYNSYLYSQSMMKLGMAIGLNQLTQDFTPDEEVYIDTTFGETSGSKEYDDCTVEGRCGISKVVVNNVEIQPVDGKYYLNSTNNRHTDSLVVQIFVTASSKTYPKTTAQDELNDNKVEDKEDNNSSINNNNEENNEGNADEQSDPVPASTDPIDSGNDLGTGDNYES